MARGARDGVAAGAPSAPAETAARPRRLVSGRPVLWAAVAVFLVVTLPVVIRGAPLADDFTNCVQPHRIGVAGALGASIDRLGASRKAHLVEILLTSAVCGHVPFGVAIAVPLALTLAIAFLLRGLLDDLGAPAPWPDVGGALCLLAPLGTESALWPAALHVPLGIALALVAIRLHRSGRTVFAALAVVAAGLSAEQMLLALPLAVWMLTTPERRRRATIATACVVAALLVAFLAWPGSDPRLHVTLAERLSSALHDPVFPVLFAAVGLGVQSIPLAVVWALPVSVVVLAAGGALGWRFAPRLLASASSERPAAWPSPGRLSVAALALVVALNVPVVFNVPHQGSPRLFAPTWLVLAGSAALAGPWISRARLNVWGLGAGLFAAGAVLSLCLSVWVRLESASFSEYAVERIAAGVPDGSVVAVCGVTRTVVDPAPRGAFALHELDYDWAARDALEHYTGKRVTFRLAGPLWGRPCPSANSVDRVFSFPLLVDGWRADG
jgi:hypothetical protein